MRRLIRLLSTPLVLAAALALPASTAAIGGFSTSVLRDDCVGMNGWTSSFTASETVSGLTTANRLTIDSKVQGKSFVGNNHWHDGHVWPRRTLSFVADGTDHTLQLHRRFAGGGIEHLSRIVFKMRAWHNGTVLWSETLRSLGC